MLSSEGLDLRHAPHEDEDAQDDPGHPGLDDRRGVYGDVRRAIAAWRLVADALVGDQSRGVS